MIADGFEHYTAGERVEALDLDCHTWRPAWIEKDAPYPRSKTGGAYILWADIAPGACASISRGGWKAARWIRRPSSVTA